MTATNSLDAFLAAVEGRAFRMAWYATGNREDALEIVQEAMLGLVRRYRERDASEWPPLFHRVLQNRIRDWQRRERVRSAFRFLFPTREQEEEDPVEALPDDPRYEPPNQIAEAQLAGAITRAIRELPLRQQQAFLLRAWEGLDTAATARAMGCSEGSVKTHYSRAQQALRERLQGEGHE